MTCFHAFIFTLLCILISTDSQSHWEITVTSLIFLLDHLLLEFSAAKEISPLTHVYIIMHDSTNSVLFLTSIKLYGNMADEFKRRKNV